MALAIDKDAQYIKSSSARHFLKKTLDINETFRNHNILLVDLKYKVYKRKSNLILFPMYYSQQ